MIEPTPFAYRLFGLTVASAIELPLAPAEPDAPAEVTIGRADLAGWRGEAAGNGALVRVAAGALFRVPGVACYGIAGGRTILVDALPGASRDAVRLYLLGTAFGILLHQRRLLPLHANALAIGGRAVLFMGPSGAGKSTLAGYLHARGHRLLSDDVCVIRRDADGAMWAEPGLARIRLLGDAMQALGYAPDEDARAAVPDKYEVAARPDDGAGAVRVGAIYLLGRADGDDPTIRRLGGAEAAGALIANTYRGKAIPIVGDGRAHWAACVALASIPGVFAFLRPWGHDRFARGVVAVEAHLREAPPPAD